MSDRKLLTPNSKMLPILRIQYSLTTPRTMPTISA